MLGSPMDKGVCNNSHMCAYLFACSVVFLNPGNAFLTLTERHCQGHSGTAGTPGQYISILVIMVLRY